MSTVKIALVALILSFASVGLLWATEGTDKNNCPPECKIEKCKDKKECKDKQECKGKKECPGKKGRCMDKEKDTPPKDSAE